MGSYPAAIFNPILLPINKKAEQTTKSRPVEYQIEYTSWRVVKLIKGNTKLSNKWCGIK
jgi:hypothetical protein